MSNETVTYSLDVVLKEIKDSIKEVSQKFDKIDERLTKVEIGIADIKGDIKVLDEKIEGIDNRLRSHRSLIFSSKRVSNRLKSLPNKGFSDPD
ncbi:MAG: hypothetical protein O9324_12310 [Microcystis sp. LE19-84.1B]|jgi:archaellum component FlaC|uniref:hypothetical protein n=1 Tax=Microcystis sp. LE19-84.1B TaxID=3016438 RepID=UPI0022C93698|nr:hypothetical protein [Microcystis sp. LE19-84.1B]MCZ8224701.1 hypothetical protein [Microcystis sp. LE19-84.1B]